MTLNDILRKMMEETMAACQPSDLKTGTVASAAPLAITIDGQAAPLRGAQLLLTEPVIEKKIPVLEHSHQISGLGHTHTVTGLGHSHSTAGLEHTHTVDGLSHTHTLEEGATGAALDGGYASGAALAGSYPSDRQLTGSYLTSSALGGVASNGALGNVACIEHGVALPVEDGYIILNRALAAGDKVLLLRVMGGQRFIVLSRVFEGG